MLFSGNDELVTICFRCARASAAEVVCSVCGNPMAYSIPEWDEAHLKAYGAEWLTLKLAEGPLKLYELHQASKGETTIPWEVLMWLLDHLDFIDGDVARLPDDHPMRGENSAAVRL